MITHYCIIRNHSLVVDGKVIFSGGTSLDDFLLNAYMALAIDYPKFFKMDNMSKAGLLAAEMLIRLARPGIAENYRTALVLSNSQSSLDTDKKFLNSTRTVASPSLFVYTLPNIVAGEICIKFKIKGENFFFVTPKFDADVIVEHSSAALDSGASNCISGWVDVLDEQHDVFLYLLEKQTSDGIEHSAVTVDKLYQSTYGKSDA